jgi:hypothetical protein
MERGRQAAHASQSADIQHLIAQSQNRHHASGARAWANGRREPLTPKSVRPDERPTRSNAPGIALFDRQIWGDLSGSLGPASATKRRSLAFSRRHSNVSFDVATGHSAVSQPATANNRASDSLIESAAALARPPLGPGAAGGESEPLH